jgi:hypothetical protein
MSLKLPSIEESLPKRKTFFYGGSWHDPMSTGLRETINPGNGSVIDLIPQAKTEDVDIKLRQWYSTFAKHVL